MLDDSEYSDYNPVTDFDYFDEACYEVPDYIPIAGVPNFDKDNNVKNNNSNVNIVTKVNIWRMAFKLM